MSAHTHTFVALIPSTLLSQQAEEIKSTFISATNKVGEFNENIKVSNKTHTHTYNMPLDI